MTQQPAEIQVKDIDHLGIVAGIIDQMAWVKGVEQFGVLMKSIHLDSSSFHVDGEYNSCWAYGNDRDFINQYASVKPKTHIN
jgi:hypothetical protein